MNYAYFFGSSNSTYSYSYYQCRASNIAVVDTTFNVFSYDAENRSDHLLDDLRMRYVLRYIFVIIPTKNKDILIFREELLALLPEIRLNPIPVQQINEIPPEVRKTMQNKQVYQTID